MYMGINAAATSRSATESDTTNAFVIVHSRFSHMTTRHTRTLSTVDTRPSTAQVTANGIRTVLFTAACSLSGVSGAVVLFISAIESLKFLGQLTYEKFSALFWLADELQQTAPQLFLRFSTRIAFGMFLSSLKSNRLLSVRSNVQWPLKPKVLCLLFSKLGLSPICQHKSMYEM